MPSCNIEKNTGNHHASCSKLCLLCMRNHVKNLTIIAKCMLTPSQVLMNSALNFSGHSHYSVNAMPEKSNSRNTLTLHDNGVSKSGEARCGAQGKSLCNILSRSQRTTVLSNTIILQTTNKIRRALRARTPLIRGRFHTIC